MHYTYHIKKQKKAKNKKAKCKGPIPPEDKRITRGACAIVIEEPLLQRHCKSCRYSVLRISLDGDITKYYTGYTLLYFRFVAQQSPTGPTNTPHEQYNTFRYNTVQWIAL